MRDLTKDSVHLFVKDDVQLFIDKILIEVTQDLTRRFYQPVRALTEPVLKRDKPWEQDRKSVV